MNSFKTYLPLLYEITNGKLLLYLKDKALHFVLNTNKGHLYRCIIDDINDFKEDVGYAFDDKFTVVCLNSLKNLTLKLQPETAKIVVILAKRQCTIELKSIDYADCFDFIGLMGVSKKIPNLPADVPMGPPPDLPKPVPKRKQNENILQFRRKRKK
ncbi:MAG: hypothetical protein CMC93_00540 [Flavobacteriaceae bacterium]|nr:hypothetical protein [Flavobacteriaceae bacterium]